jgi:23S rRNA (cytidine1920-2'-O)/16S rRNA (cytidine1409-2'-O)-methyltransferase
MAERLDERLVADGLADSRSKAQRIVMAGLVRVNGELRDKPAAKVQPDDVLEVEALPRFVSRGGDKLENGLEDLAADLERLGLSASGAHALDVGSSTGGFTDCLLQRGAAGVVSVDVGYGQLHPKLRDDPRVTVMERTNARHLTPDMLPWAPDTIVCDASFIPLRTVLPAPLACMREGFWGMLLCKPQFEAGRERLTRAGRKGVIRDEAVRDEIVGETVADVEGLGMRVEAMAEARPRGPKGNVEYVLLVTDARASSGTDLAQVGDGAI